MSDQETTSGVQGLIDRLSQEGVAEGQRQAEEIVTDAQRKADSLLESARGQASAILEQARQQADEMKAAGEEALRLAARDTLRDFSARIHEGFRDRLDELVRHELSDAQLIKDMILEVTRRATDELGSKQVEILIPSEFVSEQEARQRIDAGDADALNRFVHGLIGEDLREGFTISLGSQSHEGFTLRVVDDKLEIDLSGEAIAEFLSLHLMPRFRAIMRKESA